MDFGGEGMAQDMTQRVGEQAKAALRGSDQVLMLVCGWGGAGGGVPRPDQAPGLEGLVLSAANPMSSASFELTAAHTLRLPKCWDYRYKPLTYKSGDYNAEESNPRRHACKGKYSTN